MFLTFNIWHSQLLVFQHNSFSHHDYSNELRSNSVKIKNMMSYEHFKKYVRHTFKLLKCWRTEKINWTDHVKNGDVLETVTGENKSCILKNKGG